MPMYISKTRTFPANAGVIRRVLYQVYLMFTVIAHDFVLDCYEGGKYFDCLDEARDWAEELADEVRETVTVWIQSDGLDEMIKDGSDPFAMI
jgi:hypothetical protein